MTVLDLTIIVLIILGVFITIRTVYRYLKGENVSELSFFTASVIGVVGGIICIVKIISMINWDYKIF